MWSRVLSVFLSLWLIAMPSMIRAETSPQPPSSLEGLSGRVTSLNMDEPAPYAGILLDSEAAAKMLAEKKFLGLQHELKLDLEIKKLTAIHELNLGLLQSRYDSLQTQHEQVLEIKNSEIFRLQEIVKDRPNSNSEWWLAGGIVIGIALSIGIFYAAVEISE